ncbi:MAG: asparaginase [Candidatus Gastranaerophilaceae bacterium]
MYPEYELLSRHKRGGLYEEEHFGIILEYFDNEIIKIAGDGKAYPFYHRSCMKPLQFAAVSEIIDAFNFTDKEIAVCTASHSGEDFHIQTITNILNKIGLSEKDLLCPPLMPLDSNAKHILIKQNKNPRAIHNNCSGKHAAMLAYCVLKGFDIKNYNNINHPLQKYVLNFCAEICEKKLTDCPVSKDGCTLPVIATPLENLAKGFLKVYTHKKYKKIAEAVLKNPYYAGGHGRLDSEIIAASNGKLTAKVGAGNLCCVVDVKTKKSFVIKLSDPDNFSRGLILSTLLNKMNYFENFEQSNLAKMLETKITDETGFQVGSIEIFPK